MRVGSSLDCPCRQRRERMIFAFRGTGPTRRDETIVVDGARLPALRGLGARAPAGPDLLGMTYTQSVPNKPAVGRCLGQVSNYKSWVRRYPATAQALRGASDTTTTACSSNEYLPTTGPMTVVGA